MDKKDKIDDRKDKKLIFSSSCLKLEILEIDEVGSGCYPT